MVVKDLNKVKNESNLITKNDNKVPADVNSKEGKLLQKKRVKNVLFDKDADGDSDKETNSKSKKIGNDHHYNNPKASHHVKFSGEEYKNKKAKGDKLIQGKYEPFAYIQLNPKSTNKKKRTDTMKVFENIMNTHNK